MGLHLGAARLFRKAKDENDKGHYKYDDRADCENCRERQRLIHGGERNRRNRRCGSEYASGEREEIKRVSKPI
jgi:hypothetical protein